MKKNNLDKEKTRLSFFIIKRFAFFVVLFLVLFFIIKPIIENAIQEFQENAFNTDFVYEAVEELNNIDSCYEKGFRGRFIEKDRECIIKQIDNGTNFMSSGVSLLSIASSYAEKYNDIELAKKTLDVLSEFKVGSNYEDYAFSKNTYERFKFLFMFQKNHTPSYKMYDAYLEKIDKEIRETHDLHDYKAVIH
jgi:hypothetical protein